MGVLTDYFRAKDAASVVEALERTGGGSPVGAGAGARAFEGVEAKRVDPVVLLGQLVAAVRGCAWRLDLVEETTVWPTSPKPGPKGPCDEDDPWATGPWVSELGPEVRDLLAGVEEADVPTVAAAWVRAEELDGASAEDMRPLVEELTGLARRARDAGERLYCWVSL